jgi:long-chain acyl-CoA synthetase
VTFGLLSFTLASPPKVKNIYVHNEMFSIQNGLLTPTLKAKRPELREFFKGKIDDLYNGISM